ncbi:MAG TPA: penicillin-binding protein [Patescibacteria group bacterium]|nr:penicillin-binding protein [Patescibacteria group bacterium]
MIEFFKRYYNFLIRRTRANWQTIKSGTRKQRVLLVIRLALYCFALILILGSVTFAVVALSLPDPNKLNDRQVAQSTKIYASDGLHLLYEVHGEVKRTLVDPKDLPAYVGEASIAIEDKNFYNNPGVDWRGILRSVYVDVTSGSKSQGGSTITQQFVRNAILTNQKSWIRKIKEAVLAIEIDQKFSKDDILKLYLNEIPYGQNAYGIQAAAQSYFGIDAKNLDLAQAAYLASLPQGPSLYNPNGPNRDLLDARHEQVLDNMYEQGYITEQQRDDAKKEVVVFSKIKDAIQAPHFVTYVEQQLAAEYGEQTLEEGGLTVITTLDWNLQQLAQQAVDDGVARNTKSNKADNAGLIAIDPKTGKLLAMVGSADYFNDDIDGQVNVTLRPLQPGSSIKPYVYATAFKQGMGPATMLTDVVTDFGTYGGKDYIPHNYDNSSHGVVSIRTALDGSLNVPAVKTLDLVGVQNAIDTMKDMGITADISADKCGLSLVLGGCEIELLDHTSAMGVFANTGVRHNVADILSVTDPQGNILQQWQADEGTQVLDPQVAYEINNVLSDNNARAFVFGSNSPLTLPGRPVAAKTGTTQSWKDGWTLGYTPSLVAGVWTGNTDGTPMRAGADGVVTAGPIWHEFMASALKDTPVEQFQEPAGIQHILVDSLSGKLPTQYSPSTKEEVFSSFAKLETDDVHVPVQINKQNGLLATDQTPPDLVETKVYTVIHSEKPNDPAWENPVEAWAKAAGYSYPPTQQDNGSVDQNFITNQVKFITPTSNQEITSLPLNVQVDPGASNVSEIDLDLDGIPEGSKNSAPYTFTIDSAKKGWQTLTATVKLSDTSSITTSIRIHVNIPK